MEADDLSDYWTDLYQRYRVLMVRAAASVIAGDHRRGDPTASGFSAEDVVADVFRELIVKGERLRSEDPRSFLYTRTKDRAKDKVKGRRPVPTGDAEKFDVADRSAALVDDEALDRVEADIVAGALDALPERERYVIDERVRHARPAIEVAEGLGVTPQRVSQLVRQAIGRLREDRPFMEAITVGNPEGNSNDHEGGEP